MTFSAQHWRNFRPMMRETLAQSWFMVSTGPADLSFAVASEVNSPVPGTMNLRFEPHISGEWSPDRLLYNVLPVEMEIEATFNNAELVLSESLEKTLRTDFLQSVHFPMQLRRQQLHGQNESLYTLSISLAPDMRFVIGLMQTGRGNLQPVATAAAALSMFSVALAMASTPILEPDATATTWQDKIAPVVTAFLDGTEHVRPLPMWQQMPPTGEFQRLVYSPSADEARFINSAASGPAAGLRLWTPRTRLEVAEYFPALGTEERGSATVVANGFRSVKRRLVL